MLECCKQFISFLCMVIILMNVCRSEREISWKFWGGRRMQLLLKFEVEDIRLAFTTKCYTVVWQSEGAFQHFGGQNCKELM